MKLQTQPQSDWQTSISLLARIHPPQSVVYVGSQPASAPSRVWQQWGVKSAVVIDPTMTEAGVGSLPAGWLQISAVLGSHQEDNASFYSMSMASESGLLPVDALRALWPNIQQIGAENRTVVNLDEVLAGLPDPQPVPDWLVVDSFPALNVLDGAEKALTSVPLVCARVMLAKTADHPALGACSVEATAALVEAQGYVCAAVIETRHPLLGIAIFVRNLRRDLRQQEVQLSEAQQVLSQQLQASRQRADELAQQLQVEAQAKAGLSEQLKTLQDNAQQLAQEKAAQAEVLKVAQQKSAELAQQLEASQHRADELAQQLQVEAQAKAGLSEQLKTSQDNAQQLAQEKAAQAEALKVAQQKSAELAQRVPKLEADRQEQAQRQHLLQEELVRAEAQLELIKDLLLREPGL